MDISTAIIRSAWGTSSYHNLPYFQVSGTTARLLAWFSMLQCVPSLGNHWLTWDVYQVMDPLRVHQSATLQALI